ncbi:MAG: HAD family phosphatase [Balneolales bacterium]
MNTNFGVIFDMDGVLVHSNPAHKKAIKIFCDNHQLNVTDTFLENRVYGRTNKEWIPELFGDLPDEEIQRLADDKEALFRRNFDPVAECIPGLTGFLDVLKANGIKTMVATSAPGENADFILDALNIRSYFDSVLDSSHVDKGKPEPEVYLKAASALQLPPDRCFVIEDSIAGVEAGIRAGAKVIGVTSTHTAREFEKCVKVIDDFTDLSVDDLTEIMASG